MQNENNWTKFIASAGEIEKSLLDRFRRGDNTADKFHDLIVTAALRKCLPDKDIQFLHFVREIRNICSHRNNIQLLKQFLSVKQETLDKMAHIVNRLKEKTTAKQILIKDIYSRGLNDSLSETIEKMRACNYSHVPILNKDNKVIGIFGEDTILNKIVIEGAARLSESTEIKECEDYIGMDSTRSEAFKFISEHTSILEIDKIFFNSLSNNRRLSLLLVTKKV